MATLAKYTRILVDEYDFSTDSNSLSIAIAIPSIDVTCFQATAYEWLSSFPSGSIVHGGFMIPSTSEGTLEKEIYDRIGSSTSAIVTAQVGTNTDACPSYVLSATYTDTFEIDTPIEGALMVNGNWIGTIRRGLRMWTGTFSSMAAQTSPAYIDLGAQATAGGFAYLHIQAIVDGATNAVIILESDDNTGFSSAATECTWTFSAVGAEEKTLSGTIDRYIRLRCTDLGTATSFTVVGIACASGITY
ncbi:hypothetical protein LCGC14_0386690 [marine sediment metagenome]|uniref:Uncharacterized protein n=1 Tax=marine sediment metagenome TaxID=412755 RepID=A0A0F9VMU9_9ZZZZ